MPVSNDTNPDSVDCADTNPVDDIAIHSDGSAIVIWANKSTPSAFANRYERDPATKMGQWLTAIPISQNRITFEYRLAMDAQGNVLTIMQGGSGAVYAHRILRSTPWSEADINIAKYGYTVAPIGNTGDLSASVNIAVGRNGSGIAIWNSRTNFNTTPVVPTSDNNVLIRNFKF